MAQPFRLQLLLDRARDELDAAARHLGQQTQRLAEQETKLQMLTGYREEYRQRFAASGRTGLSAQLLQDWHRFMGRLEEAVATQHREIARFQSLLAAAREAWLDKQRVVRAYETLAARQAAREAAVEARREQKLFDEIGQRRRNPFNDT